MLAIVVCVCILVCVCVHVCMHVCVYKCTCIYLCIYVEARGQQECCPPPLRQGFSLGWSSSARVAWMTRNPEGSSFLCLPNAGIISTLPRPTFLCGFRGAKSGPCSSSALPDEHSPAPLMSFLCHSC